MQTSPIQFAMEVVPPGFLQLLKRTGVRFRYTRQKQRCRTGYKNYSGHYTQTTLFVAGLPKSGTTWLEKMLASFPGFHQLLIPEATEYELVAEGSHDYELPDDIFDRFRNMLVITKMHVHGSPHNTALLHDAGVKYVVLYRDLRDVAVSHFFYVRQTPWHPEYSIYRRLELHEALLTFAQRTLVPFANWVRSWEENRDRELSMVVRYEEMLANTFAVMTKVACHFELDSSPQTIQRIVDRHSFKRLSGGRQRGQDSDNSFFRKGVVGDWQNHFTSEIKDVYKEMVGDFLIQFGYEEDYSW